MMKQDKKTYNQARFRRVLQSKLKGEGEGSHDSKVSKPHTKATLQKDSCDLLIYLIYVNFMNELLEEGALSKNGGAGEEGEVTSERLDTASKHLLKKYRG